MKLLLQPAFSSFPNNQCCHQAESPPRSFITQAPPGVSREHQPVPKRQACPDPGDRGFADLTAAVFHPTLAPAEVPGSCLCLCV
ncbi:hypothetical protein ACSS6W_005570 [Trichoderma asperelloides]|nr:hypothetical protein LI328DRAFT_136026 [Trichoderma asperelloides]